MQFGVKHVRGAYVGQSFKHDLASTGTVFFPGIENLFPLLALQPAL